MDIRQGLELGCKALLMHWVGESYYRDDLVSDISNLQEYGIINDEDFIGKLHNARRHCNSGVHANGEVTYNQLFFSNKVLEEFVEQRLKELI